MAQQRSRHERKFRFERQSLAIQLRARIEEAVERTALEGEETGLGKPMLLPLKQFSAESNRPDLHPRRYASVNQLADWNLAPEFWPGGRLLSVLSLLR